MKVTEAFPLHSIGMITARDAYVIDFEPEPIIDRAKAFRDSKLDDEATCKALGIPIKKGWNITRARERIKQVKDMAGCVQRLLYRPFDVQHVFYHESLIWGMAWPVMQNMVGGKNLALITSRMTKGEEFHHAFVSNTLSEVILLSSKTSNNAFAFPLHLRSQETDLQLGAMPFRNSGINGAHGIFDSSGAAGVFAQAGPTADRLAQRSRTGSLSAFGDGHICNVPQRAANHEA